MNKNRHVGRPTNEEVHERKVKKILFIVIPIVIFIAIIGAIVGYSDINNLMGNSTKSKKSPIYKSRGSYNPKKGDIVFLSFNSNYLATHVGIVYSVSGNNVVIISGNTDCESGCKRNGNKNCKSQCKNDTFYIKNSIVDSEKYSKNSKNITGYINMTQVSSSTKAKSLAELAYLEINKKRKGEYYFKNSSTWKSEGISGYTYDWCTTFMAWVLEQGKVSPKGTLGWNRGCTAWLKNAQNIKK